ncbi:MAG: DNA repair protein RecO [Mariniphaga sp.]|nr:DNA repair protein RecO [Mariniphaga sp.]
MLVTTQGIVLHFIRFGDNSIIVNIYTREYGRQAYLMHISRSRRSQGKIGVFQPLFLVDLIAYQKDTREVQTIKEIKNQPVYQNIPFDVVKSTQAIFIAEILSKTLREQESVPDLFEFLTNSILFFDLAEGEIAGFHLWFLIRLTEYLGFKPNIENFGFRNWFDLQKGVVVPYEPSHSYFMHPEATRDFCRITALKINELENMKLSREQRSYLTQKVVEYYQLHFEHLGEVKSLKVLQEVFS